ncbi:MAG: hypothetical protein K1060chlam4_00191 [Candidatus Anoxychlamydiales bacterium]|nr:hypothetical protein [Candidatus Anoxychlamydiales bacterium]
MAIPPESKSYFGPSRIEEREQGRHDKTEQLAPIFKEAVTTVATTVLGLQPNEAVRTLAPTLGPLIGESAECLSKTACHKMVIPGAAKLEEGSGFVQNKFEKLC